MKMLSRILMFVFIWLITLPASAAPSRQPKRCDAVDPATLSAPFVFQYGLTAPTLQGSFYGDPFVATDGSYADLGYRPARMTGYLADGGVRFATKWVKDSAGAWDSRVGLTGAQFHARFLDLKAKGFRLIDASGYETPSGVRYADIWLENQAGLGWAVTRDVPAWQLDGVEVVRRAEGLAPTRVEGYLLNGALHYIVVWQSSRCAWMLEQGLSGAQYQAHVNLHLGTMRPIHVDSYRPGTGGHTQFASILWAQGGPPVRAVHGHHWYLFQRQSNRASCDGFVPDSFYGVELADGFEAYGAIWSYGGAPGVNASAPADQRVAHQVNCAQGRAGAALINPGTGEHIMAHADQIFGSASAIKVAVLYGVLRKLDAEAIDPEATQIADTSVAELMTTMIQNSSNSATNTLIDYVGRATINDELAALGLKVVRIHRYLTGGPSAYGGESWFDDFKAGYDNVVTPRELATLWQRLYENEGLLSAGSYLRFTTITSGAPTMANDALPAGYDPNFVTYYNKPGGKTYTGVAGDFAHRPQLATHKVGADAGVMVFANGQRVYYAAIVDQADQDASVAAIACVGWEAAKTWGPLDGNAGDGQGFCGYP